MNIRILSGAIYLASINLYSSEYTVEGGCGWAGRVIWLRSSLPASFRADRDSN